ncbi:phenylacetate--CoA ligase [Sesbania bispinosa]|nr:phenylacetate--CoA ligase [Sesbania bispinosa]
MDGNPRQIKISMTRANEIGLSMRTLSLKCGRFGDPQKATQRPKNEILIGMRAQEKDGIGT